MRILRKLTPAVLISLLLLLALACEGGGGDESSSNQPADGGRDSSDVAVLSAVEALGRSADDFQAEVESLEGEMTMDMSMAEMAFGFRGDFAFQSPDQMHMRMEFAGGEDTVFDLSQLGDVEVLMLGEQMYMKMPLFGGWVAMSLDDLGLDAAQFEELLSDQSPFDYSKLIEGLDGEVAVQDLGEEELDGAVYRHYRVESDFGTLLEAFAGAFGEDLGGGAFPVDDVSGPVVMDLWLDGQTLLPYRLTAEGTFGLPEMSELGMGESMTFAMTVTINQYNEPVSMPDAPEDAISFSELGEDMFGEFE